MLWSPLTLVDRFPKKYREEAPRLAKDSKGGDASVLPDTPHAEDDDRFNGRAGIAPG
jgi:hypothetical protein